MTLSAGLSEKTCKHVALSGTWVDRTALYIVYVGKNILRFTTESL